MTEGTIEHGKLGSLQLVTYDAKNMSPDMYEQLGLLQLVQSGLNCLPEHALSAAETMFGPAQMGNGKQIIVAIDGSGKTVASIAVEKFGEAMGFRFWKLMQNGNDGLQDALGEHFPPIVVKVSGLITIPEYQNTGVATQLLSCIAQEMKPSVIIGETNSPAAVAVGMQALGEDYESSYGMKSLSGRAFSDTQKIIRKASHGSQRQRLSSRGLIHISGQQLPGEINENEMLSAAFDPIFAEQASLPDGTIAVAPFIAIAREVVDAMHTTQATVELPEISKVDVLTPMLKEWVSQAEKSAAVKSKIQDALAKGDSNWLIDFGFPKALLPIMQQWDEKGPDILATYAHPEWPEGFQLTGITRLLRFLEAANEKGLTFPSVRVDWYDVLDLDRCGIHPLMMGEFGNGIDLFQIGEKATSFSLLSASMLQNAYALFVQNTDSIASHLVFQLQKELGQAIVEYLRQNYAKKESLKNLRGHVLLDKAAALLQSRLNMLANLMQSTIHGHTSMTVAQALMEFSKQITGHVFGEGMVDSNLGFGGELISQDGEFGGLVKETLQYLMDEPSYGMQMIKGLVEKPGEGLALKISPTHRHMLTVDENGQFIVTNSWGDTVDLLTDEQAKDFILHELPLGKLESLAMLAGVKTASFGSEYDTRNRIITVLGLTGKAADYIAGLRIGKDREHSSWTLQIAGELSSSTLTIPLGFLMLGSKGFQQVIAHAVKTVGPYGNLLTLTPEQLRMYFAQSIVEELIAQEAHTTNGRK